MAIKNDANNYSIVKYFTIAMESIAYSQVKMSISLVMPPHIVNSFHDIHFLYRIFRLIKNTVS